MLWEAGSFKREQTQQVCIQPGHATLKPSFHIDISPNENGVEPRHCRWHMLRGASENRSKNAPIELIMNMRAAAGLAVSQTRMLAPAHRAPTISSLPTPPACEGAT
jgi:hypothetical protein